MTYEDAEKAKIVAEQQQRLEAEEKQREIDRKLEFQKEQERKALLEGTIPFEFRKNTDLKSRDVHCLDPDDNENQLSIKNDAGKSILDYQEEKKISRDDKQSPSFIQAPFEV